MSNSLESINLDFKKNFHNVFRKPQLIQPYLLERSNKFDEIIKKSVPSGVPYLIIDSSELPADTEFRDAWQADFSNPDGYGA